MHLNKLNVPNPLDTTRPSMDFFQRKHDNAAFFQEIETEIQRLFEPRFITYPATSRFIEALIEMSECKKVLELGMYTGFTALHMIRAIYPHGQVVAIEGNPEMSPGIVPPYTEDQKGIIGPFFQRPDVQKVFRLIRGRTPEVLKQLEGEVFDLVFIDSDHSLEHNERERLALWPITRPGTAFIYHDCQPMAAPGAKEIAPVYKYLMDLVKRGIYVGSIHQTPHRLDIRDIFGAGYDPRLLPHLGVFQRV